MKKLVIDFRMHKASGIGTYISNIVPFLVNCFDVTLLGMRKEIEIYDFSNDVKIIECSSPIYSIREQWELFRKIPDCDIFWSPHYNIPVLPIRARKRLVTIHDVFHLAFYETLTLKQKIYAKFILNQAVKQSDVILTDSTFSASEIKKLINGDVSNIVGCAIQPETFRVISDTGLLKTVRLKYALPDTFLLFVGNVKPHKNLINLCSALKNISDIPLVVVGKKDGFITGDNSLSTLLEEDASLQDKVFFSGYVDSEDLPIIYNLATIFVLPSFYEGFGLPPLEAQACGCPVVCSNAASLPEVCGDSVLYCDPYDAQDIADKVLQLLGDASLREDLIEKGFENIKRFNWEKSAKKIANIMDDMV